MRKAAELLVLAFLGRLGAELSFVFFDVVKAFHLVVRVLAVLLRAILGRAEVQIVVDEG